MALLACDAVLLRAVEYGESDLVVHLLTADTGRFTAIAKGARKSRRRFPGTLDLFNRLAIEGRTRARGGMGFLERARLVEPHLGLRPELGRCVRCGREPGEQVSPDHGVEFHVADGGIVCSACARGQDGLVSVALGTLRALSEGLALPADELADYQLGARGVLEAARLLFRFQRFHVGVELRSERFLEEILPITTVGAS